ncbi:hypothetical protein RQP46_007788 [Phenoliferia psychrophenolica]
MYADGLTGPFVIHSPNDPLKRGQDYDIDQIMFIRDHFHDLSTNIVDGLLTAAGYHGSVIAPSPQSGLINGVGVYNCTGAPAGSTCTERTPVELTFPPNKRIRLRLVNAGTHAFFRVSVDGHSLEVIEADDTPVHGPTVHRVPIFVAQRYSVVLSTHGDAAGDSYYFRAQINTITNPNERPSTGLPTSVDWSDATLTKVCSDLDTSSLKPRIAIDAPASADITGTFDAAFKFTQLAEFEWTLNGVSLENYMYNPLFFQVHRGGQVNSTEVTNFVIPKVETADLIINNLVGADHPFHLHSSKFWIVASGAGQINSTNAASVVYNTTNPLRRDVVTVPAASYVIIRFIADIPGVLAFHCHIAWHQAAGE